MADEHWFTALMKLPARFGRKLIDIAYVCAHWPEIEKELRRREDLIKFVEEEGQKRLQYEREAAARMKTKYDEQLAEGFKSIKELIEIAKYFRSLWGKTTFICAYAIFCHTDKLRKLILKPVEPGLRSYIEKEIQEFEKLIGERQTPIEEKPRRGLLEGLLDPPPIPAPLDKRPPAPGEDREG